MIGAIIIIIICCIIIAIALPNALKAQNKENNERIELTMKTLNIDKSTPEAIQRSLNDTVEELRTEYNKNLENFRKQNGILKIKNTNSALGFCAVNEDTLFYQIMYYENIPWELQPYNIISKNVKYEGGSIVRFKIEGINRVFTSLHSEILFKYELATRPIKAKTIPLERIECWNEEGGKYEREKISNRLSGAAVGTLMFGGIGGALLGTALAGKETEIVDNRQLVLYVKTPSGKLTKEIIAYGKDDQNYTTTHRVIKELLPNKEYKYEMFEDDIISDYQAKNVFAPGTTGNLSEIQSCNSNFTSSTAEELKRLKDLFDMGIITQEEFNAKKKQLLNL